MTESLTEKFESIIDYAQKQRLVFFKIEENDWISWKDHVGEFDEFSLTFRKEHVEKYKKLHLSIIFTTENGEDSAYISVCNSYRNVTNLDIAVKFTDIGRIHIKNLDDIKLLFQSGREKVFFENAIANWPSQSIMPPSVSKKILTELVSNNKNIESFDKIYKKINRPKKFLDARGMTEDAFSTIRNLFGIDDEHMPEEIEFYSDEDTPLYC